MAHPPPPYDSVVADGSESFFTSANSVYQDAALPQHVRAQSEFSITVTDPVKHGEGVTAYVVYRVITKTSHRSYSRPSSEVLRRFSHFTWLAEQLAEKHKGVIVPALPEKSKVQKFQMSTDFINQRARALQVFLSKVACHPVLKDAKELQQFLEASEQDWAIEMARWQAHAAAAKPAAMNGALQWLKSLQHTAQNMVAGRSDDSMEDAEYLKVRDYIHNLEAHLYEAHRQAARLVKKEAELGNALAEFGGAAELLGKHDDGLVRTSFDLLSTRTTAIANSAKQRAEALQCEFEEPLKEYARTIKSVQSAVSDRAAALSLFSQAKSELDSRKVKLAKLRGTPGLKEDKIAEAEQEVQEAEQRVRATKMAFDEIVACMTEELNRFQKERAADMKALLQHFALAQAQAAAEDARAWGALLQDIQQKQQQGGAHGAMPGQEMAGMA